MNRLTVATWNIHGAVGIDGRRMPERVADVLARMDADLIALQEVVVLRGSLDDFCAALASHLAMRVHASVTFRKKHGDFGNALLSRWPMTDASSIDLSFASREPRNAIRSTIDLNGVPLRVIATHLGLAVAERRAQVVRLASELAQTSVPTILLGDFNESKLHGALAALQSHVEFAATPATFPSLCPLLRLDRILVTQPLRASLRVQRDWRSWIASDHLPLLADIDIASLANASSRTASTQHSPATMRSGSDEESAS